ncbi:DUF924 family protein [Bordetella genomosp. 4]|uniref:DUF924 domain-containing protein n=1 Tax=Bordetella genomosp. 4 TaxID=463044 RepID=A0A261U9D0_9BORD|nr:DUF924 family protein [Bordetella genomosp. 4]OZI58211.1 hypothetical protein CAL20_07815 [Bordetella genomosp. 4]
MVVVTTLNTWRADAQDLPDEALAVVRFWRDAGADRWFNKSEAFDEEFRGRFLSLHEAAARGELDGWARTAEGALALLILLDQFPRNAFRGTARMYETDARARMIAHQAVDNGLDEQVEKALRVFFYLPFSHSENIQDQRRGVERNQRLGQPWLTHALGHADIIERFGRFPHRNPLLGRSTTAQEQAFLDAGGFAG